MLPFYNTFPWQVYNKLICLRDKDGREIHKHSAQHWHFIHICLVKMCINNCQITRHRLLNWYYRLIDESISKSTHICNTTSTQFSWNYWVHVLNLFYCSLKIYCTSIICHIIISYYGLIKTWYYICLIQMKENKTVHMLKSIQGRIQYQKDNLYISK